MKNLKTITSIIALCMLISTQAQEKKIKFNKGTLRICSSKNFQIEGYDGDEVIIKSVASNFIVEGKAVQGSDSKWEVSYGLSDVTFIPDSKKDSSNSKKTKNYFNRVTPFIVTNSNTKRKEGLKKLGKSDENYEFGIYFEIEQNKDELIFRDKSSRQLVVVSGEKYKIMIPNSIKLDWHTNSCEKNSNSNLRSFAYYESDASKLINFKGEVSISTSLHNTKLVDVTGPVSINSIGGNVTIEFDKQKPSALYSIYSNNGFIDITLPKNSNLDVLASGKSIYSDLDFKVEAEREINDFGHKMQEMKLKLNAGTVKMNLNAGYGNVYLREKK